MFYRYLILSLLILFVGCAHSPPSQIERRNNADKMALAANWEKQTLPSKPLSLVAYTPKHRDKTSVLTVYIEGDGLAWITKSLVSTDPTPQNPVGLELALRHPAGVAVYLARPCQYIADADAHNCNKTYWTDGRFSPSVIASSQEAINILMQQSGAKKLQLIGYSGGGAVAALIAAQRNDVMGLVTVAGNLDHKKWTQEHRITPLRNSMNPADYWQSLKDIPQVHFIGGRDGIIGKGIAESYASRFPINKKPHIQIIENFDHACCWSQQWPKLLHSTRSVLSSRK